MWYGSFRRPLGAVSAAISAVVLTSAGVAADSTPQPITIQGNPLGMLSPEQHDTLGAVQDWRADQLADIQNAQQPTSQEA